MSAASDRIQELVYPTKPRLYIGIGEPPDERVTAADLKAVVDERAALLAALKAMFADACDCGPDVHCRACELGLRAIAKAEGRS